MTPLREGIVVAPADGRVSRITNAVPPADLDLGDRPLPRISIFMSVFDCHVNRSPVVGKIERIAYHKGAFLSADLDKASENNERNGFVISTTKGQRRRGADRRPRRSPHPAVSCAKAPPSAAGERIGMIRFGSRVDVYLPEGGKALVAEGQTAIAGETIIADLRAVHPQLTFRVG